MMLNAVRYTPSEQKFIKRIQTYDWAKLERLWEKVRDGKKTRWSDGKALEYLFIRAFELEGIDVEYPYCNKVEKYEEQVDGYLSTRNPEVSFLVECKDWSNKVTFDELAKLNSRLSYRIPSVLGVFVSMSDYTPSAMELLFMMQPRRIILWSKNDINECFKHHKFTKALIHKYHYALMTADHNRAVIDGLNI